MKVIGLIGGMSWQSSGEYYRLINETVRGRLGGLNSARILMYSLNHHQMAELENNNQWSEAAEVVAEAAQSLERGGAHFILVCCNVLHKVAGQVQSSIGIPLVHIADATAEAVTNSGLSAIGLLGVKAVMEEDFFRGRLSSKHGLKVLVPDEAARDVVNDMILNELSWGKVVASSKKKLLQIAAGLETAGAEGLILGCTELPLLIGPQDSSLPVFDTLALHAQKAVDLALAGQAEAT
ncbi:MAG: aspartate/glutamate racemase family protein [Deltaproteobacteria bacterium]|nr:aspartate/glutamate racemase family protein [Deltaproteobacteria bacterium]